MVDYVHMQYGHEYAYVEALALHVQKWALVGSEYQDNTCSTMTSSFSKVHVYTLYCVVCIPHSAHGSLTLRNFHCSQKYFTENFVMRHTYLLTAGASMDNILGLSCRIQIRYSRLVCHAHLYLTCAVCACSEFMKLSN